MSLKHFYQDPYLHIRSFVLNFLFAFCCCAALVALRSAEFFAFHFQLWHVLLIPLGVYAGGVSAVFIHNASHGSFPAKWMDRFFGELAGMHQLWGFFGWKFIHMLHHQYSDQAGMDPHPPKGVGFWGFTKNMFLHSSLQVTKRYREHWGMSRRTQLLRLGVYVSFLSMAISHLVLWYLLLGPEGFVFFYIPSYIANHLLFAHINYFAHPVDEMSGETSPGNMNSNLYYKLANFFWFGIYFHDNHHRRPTLFNPRYMPALVMEKPKRPVVATQQEPVCVSATIH